MEKLSNLSVEELNKIRGGSFCYLGKLGPCSTCWYQCASQNGSSGSCIYYQGGGGGGGGDWNPPYIPPGG